MPETIFLAALTLVSVGAGIAVRVQMMYLMAKSSGQELKGVPIAGAITCGVVLGILSGAIVSGIFGDLLHAPHVVADGFANITLAAVAFGICASKPSDAVRFLGTRRVETPPNTDR